LRPEPADARFFYPHVYIDYARKEVFLAYENMRQHYLAVIGFGELGV
jgi:hypothetical protein